MRLAVTPGDGRRGQVATVTIAVRPAAGEGTHPLRDQISANQRRSALLVAAVAVIALAAGWAFDLVAGTGLVARGVAVAAVAAATALAFWRGDAVARRATASQPADPSRHARLLNLVEGLCVAGGLPVPALYVVDDPAPNAFTSGRGARHASITVTTGLLDSLTRVELEGVLAHELSHVRSADILPATLAVFLLGGVIGLGDRARHLFGGRGPRRAGDVALGVLGVPFVLLLPVVAGLLRLAAPGRREAVADLAAVSLTRYPPGLSSALDKLRSPRSALALASGATAHLWIVAPRDRRGGSGLGRRLTTHPPLDERIDALAEI